ncbi:MULTISPECIES: hypothetical protein [Bacillus cereus group]|uniref:hypothetical protein n=1 Tax=Bacillus cereus group TaxID=86661 RepID=UPI000BF2CBB6|nr:MULTISPECIES: hypothetical protein [Bacillus cereus group]PFN14863.1 hypothetical protein COJ72_14080 [Bacillus cereus]PHE70863.1 hypothetical protein COF77_24915 [Bacillus wiedmannii]
MKITKTELNRLLYEARTEGFTAGYERGHEVGYKAGMMQDKEGVMVTESGMYVFGGSVRVNRENYNG